MLKDLFTNVLDLMVSHGGNSKSELKFNLSSCLNLSVFFVCLFVCHKLSIVVIFCMKAQKPSAMFLH